MRASLKIMNMELDMLSEEKLLQMTKEFLQDDSLNVILYASTEMLNLAAEDELIEEDVHCADLFLPGEKALLSLHHVDVLEAGNMVVDCTSFRLVLKSLQKSKRTMYIIAESEEKAASLKKFCRSACNDLQIAGETCYEAGMDEMAVVNEINSKTPDIILLDLDSALQLQWIAEMKTRLNAKICVAIGGVSHLILDPYKEAPVVMKHLRLERLYNFLIKESRMTKFIRTRIFKKKMADYNNKNSEKDEE